MQEHKIAIIDIGSNTVRLVIYQISAGYAYREIQDVKMPIRLYQYLNEKGNLSKDGVEVLADTLRTFKAIIAPYAPEKMVATATAVMRQAKNGEKVLEELEKRTGVKIRLLSEKEESYYGQYAVSHLTSFEEAYTVDMGGGSTEVTYYRGNEIIRSRSFPFGVVRLQEMFFAGKEPGDLAAMAAAQKYVETQFDKEDWIKPRNIPIIAMGGSSRNMASVHQRMITYPITGLHGYGMSLEAIKSTKFFLASKSLDELKDLDGLSKDRADIIIPATITFQALYERVKAEQMYFVNEGLRDGLLLAMLNEAAPDSYPLSGIRRKAISHLLVNYGISEEEAERRLGRVQKILQLATSADLIQSSQRFEDYVYYGSMLYMIGSYIEADDSSMHTFYLLANSSISGFRHRERLVVALLASFKNKSLFNQYLRAFQGWFTDEQLKLIINAGNLVRFCDALNVVPVNEILKSDLEKDGSRYRLKLKWKITPFAERERADRQKKRLESVLGKKVILDFYT